MCIASRFLWLTLFALLLASSPASAQPNETKILELAPGVYFRKAQTSPVFTGCNQGWVIFKDYVIVIEANFPGQVAEVVESIRKTTDKPIRFVFDTHYHGDHADGNVKYVELGATVLAHERSQLLFQTKGKGAFERAESSPDRIKEYGGLKYGIPSMFFSHKLIFDDGDQRLELIFLGHAHTAGDAVAWLPKHKILFTGDACVNGAFNYTGDSNTESWSAVLGAMLELGPKQVAPGHGELSDATLLEKQKRYFSELRTALQDGIKNSKTLEQLKQEIDIPFYKEWTGVDIKTRGENIEHVYRELTAAQLPLEKSTSFRKWRSRPQVDYHAVQTWQAIGECATDEYFSDLAELYLKSDSSLRRQLRDYFANKSSDWKDMSLYVRRMGARVQSANDIEWIRRALAIAAIEGGRSNYEETIRSLVLLRFGAERSRINADSLLHQIQMPEFISPENKPMFESARTQSKPDMLAIVKTLGPTNWQ